MMVDEPVPALKRSRFENVFDAISDTLEEAANLKLRADIMSELNKHVSGMPVEKAAHSLGVTLPRATDLARGRISAFSLDHLVDMATRAGLVMTIRLKEPSGKAEIASQSAYSKP